MRRIAKDVVLRLAGIAGLGALLWFACSALFGLSFVVFQTGSMSPGMPIGAVALTVPVSASDIRVGEVVTVQRAGASLPVTHRVIAIAPDPARSDGRLLTLRGDANDADDPQPYPVARARLTIASAPGLGRVMEVARTPVVVGAAAIVVAALVVWAFWPAPEPAPRWTDDAEEISTAPTTAAGVSR